MKNVNYKTLVPALVAAGILVYEAATGHKVNGTTQSEMVNGAFTVIGLAGTVWGFIINHKKG